MCSVTVGVLGDICRAIEEQILPFCDRIMLLLVQNLQSAEASGVCMVGGRVAGGRELLWCLAGAIWNGDWRGSSAWGWHQCLGVESHFPHPHAPAHCLSELACPHSLLPAAGAPQHQAADPVGLWRHCAGHRRQVCGGWLHCWQLWGWQGDGNSPRSVVPSSC